MRQAAARARLSAAVFLGLLGAVPPDPPPRRRPIPDLRRPALGAGVALAAAALLGLAALWASAPAASALPPPASDPAVTLLASDGQPFARRGTLRAAPVDVRDLPAHVPAAFVAIEDRRFYRHHGVDLIGVARAAVADLGARAIVQGGSTITEQLVKNTEVGSRQTLGRKLREAAAAVRLERRLSKDEILSRYLSTVYFGEGAYGLGAAARHYFDVAPEDLTLGQAAMLAGLVKAPSQLAPHRHLPQAQARARLVLQAMVETGRITPAEAQAEAPVQVAESPELDELGGYFADWIYPAIARQAPPDAGPLAVRTTLDLDLQRRAQAAVRSRLAAYDGRGGRPQAALVAMRTDGSVVAMVGGTDHAAAPFNRAVQAKRQVGSTFKLFAYLAALRQGATPETLVTDAPLEIDGWRPRNADRQTHGVMTLEEAFARSSNLAAVRVSQAVGLPAVIRAARDLGVTSRLDPVPSLPLGASGMSLLELTSAYAAVAAGVYPVQPVAVAGARPASGQRPMDDGVREGMLRLLNAAAQGAGPAAELPVPVFGKTGTTQDYRDALFVGFAGDLVVGVWVGNDDERPMDRVYGATLPARIWADFMGGALAGEQDVWPQLYERPFA